MFYPVYTLLKIKTDKSVRGKETAACAEQLPAEKILTESVGGGGFLDITAAWSLARPITQSIRTCYLYTTYWLSSCTPGDGPIFAFPRLVKRFQSHTHANDVSLIRIKVSLEIKIGRTVREIEVGHLRLKLELGFLQVNCTGTRAPALDHRGTDRGLRIRHKIHFDFE